MSGDDPATTDKNEGWNPLFSRYPQISELYSLTLLTETGIPAYWTNIQIYRALVKLVPTEETKLELSYNYLKADKTFSAAGGPFAPMFSGSSKDRGQLITAKLNRKFSPILDGYVLIEQFSRTISTLRQTSSTRSLCAGNCSGRSKATHNSEFITDPCPDPQRSDRPVPMLVQGVFFVCPCLEARRCHLPLQGEFQCVLSTYVNSLQFISLSSS